MARSWIAFLLLINYLLVVGMGCISRPEDQQELLLIQTSETGGTYQECRYLRMDGLENFLLESLASRYQQSSETPKHHLISVVSGVDAHCLSSAQCLADKPGYQIAHVPIVCAPHTVTPGLEPARLHASPAGLIPRHTHPSFNQVLPVGAGGHSFGPILAEHSLY